MFCHLNRLGTPSGRYRAWIYPLTGVLVLSLGLFSLNGCSTDADTQNASQATELEVINDILVKDTGEPTEDYDQADDGIVEEAVTDTVSTADELRASLNITEDYRDSFVHGDKGAEYQKYIMLHDTEGDSDAESVISWWDSNGAGVAAHFVINKDGSIVQCVDMDKIAHHAGFGDTGHNEYYGVTDESRDDKVGTEGIGDWASDYGMNSYSIGIELVHVSGEGDYPEAQLEALDNLIAYIDAYYGFESTIIDHKAWRTGNSDTSAEFAQYLESYQSTRRHN